MDHITTNTASTSTSSNSYWDLDMTMANPLPLDHRNPTPFEFFHPNNNMVNQFHHLHHFPPNPQFNPNSNIPPQDPYDIDEAEDDDDDDDNEDHHEQLGAMKEMMYKIAAMQPVDIDPSTIRKPKRRNVRISDDPQSIAARHRRERISERIRILQRLVPGGTKMDTASMLDEAIRYVKFLKRQVHELQQSSSTAPAGSAAGTVVVDYGLGLPPPPTGAGLSSSGLGFGFSTVGHGTNNFR